MLTMTTIYKLTDSDMRTHGGFQWKLNKEYRSGCSNGLCKPDCLHVYTDPLVAVFMAPIHGGSAKYTRLFVGDGDIKIDDHGLKAGCTRVVLRAELQRPKMTVAQRVRAAILCAWAVCADDAWRRWAGDWLSGRDRSAAKAEEAAWAARAAAREAASAAAWAAQAAWAARAARAAGAARAAAWAAEEGAALINLPAILRLAIAGPRSNPFGRSL